MMLLTLRGTPTLYYGDELGLENVPIRPEELRDPFGLILPGQGRDPERTPMPWDQTPNAGFTSGHPWLPLGNDRPLKSVAVQKQQKDSMLDLTQSLLALRRREPALSVGEWEPLPMDGEILAYVRSAAGRRFIVALNLSAEPRTAHLDRGLAGTIALSTHPGRSGVSVSVHIDLLADEGIIVDATRAAAAQEVGAAAMVDTAGSNRQAPLVAMTCA